MQDGQPSATTDQYSLAVTYYELRTGVLPYQSETLAAVMAAKEQEKLDYSRVPSGEQAVLRRATSRDPAKRYPSAAVMVKALRDAEATSTISTSGMELRSAKSPLRRLAVFLALIVLIAGSAVGGWYFWNNSREHPSVGGQPHEGGEQATPPAIKIRFYRHRLRELKRPMPWPNAAIGAGPAPSIPY